VCFVESTHLETTANVALGVDKGLALLKDNRLGNVVGVLADEVLELEDDTLAAHDRGLRPGLEGLGGSGNSLRELIGGGLGNVVDDLLRSLRDVS
jgi:hypothetical protein